jgi:hypothetical protein
VTPKARTLRSLTPFPRGSEEYADGWRHEWQTSEGWFRVGYARGVEFVPYGNAGYSLPARFKVEIKGSSAPYTVVLEMEVKNGRPECVSMLLHRLEEIRSMGRTPGLEFNLVWRQENQLSSLGLRKVRVEHLIRRATLAALHQTAAGRSKRAAPLRLDEWAALYAADSVPDSPPAGQRLSDEHYRKVAEVYRTAAKEGPEPTNAVKAHFQVSRSTAGRWVVEARARHILGPTVPGRAGEKAPTRRTSKPTRRTSRRRK